MPWFVSAYLAAVSVTIIYRVLESWGSVTGSVRLSQQNILPSLKSVRNSHRKNDQNVISQSSLSVVSRLAHLEICTERMIKTSSVRTLYQWYPGLHSSSVNFCMVHTELAPHCKPLYDACPQNLCLPHCKPLHGAHRTCATL